MANNIELIGIQSNKIDKSESEIIKRIIDARAESQTDADRIQNQMIGIKFSINKYLNDSVNSEVIEAGQFLNDILKAHRIKKNKFAKYIGLSEPNLHALLKGRRKINNDIARKLEQIFKIDAQAWLYMETKNEIKKFNSKSKINSKEYSINELVG
jgi:plasmid maintenance system antidote protein VapI